MTKDNVVSEVRFQALQWERGTGFWGANLHKEACPFKHFREAFPSEGIDVIKARYISYLISWVLFHKREPKAEDISANAGEEILAIVLEKVEAEHARSK